MIHRFPATQRLCKPTQILRRNQTQETRRGSEKIELAIEIEIELAIEKR